MQICRFIVCGLLLLCSFQLVEAGCRVKDDRGNIYYFAKPVARIVTLAPSLAEMVFEAGAADRLVGVSSNTNYPPAASSLPVIADASGVNVERVVSLHPSVVLAWQGGNPSAPLMQLKRLGIPVYFAHVSSLVDIPRTLLHIGCMAGTLSQANQSAARFMNTLSQLKDTYDIKPKVSVFYQVWSKPLLTINDDSMISEVIRLCGGRNIFDAMLGNVPQVSQEAVIKANPDAIVASEKGTWQAQWRVWSKLNAVRLGDLFTIDPDLLDRPDVRILQGATEMCQDLEKVRKQLKTK